ncbi:MAG: 50S ribosomal protein L4 [Candidatus Omnitrophica bacterium]|nr:50S ribosomal protein L4 [Candidatus Omnitrophota bacterium]
MKVPVYSKQGKKKKEIELNAEIFGVRVNERLLQLARTAFAANLRRGTAATKTRKDVRGGGKKPWRQKGTGRARAGSSRSPIWRGGGTVFGPHPRSYNIQMPKSMRKQALIAALSLRAKEQNLVVLEGVNLETHKTKEFAQIVKSLPMNKKRALCIVKSLEGNLKKAGQNLEGLVQLKQAADVNAYHVLQRGQLIIEETALEQLENAVLAKKSLSEAKS